jgi:periplasmic divalent cation tolerance protein
VVLSTAPEGQGVALARGIVDSGLAACVNVLPGARSVYRWEGSVHEDPEAVLIMKTTEDRVLELESHVRSAHPYDTPEFVVLAVDSGSEAYLRWVTEVTSGSLETAPGSNSEAEPHGP